MSEFAEVTDWYDRICGRRRFIVKADQPANPDELHRLNSLPGLINATFTAKVDWRPLVVPEP